jgi:hypothetical protein
MKTWKCKLCNKASKGYGHNGQPLVNGQVCDKCNTPVIMSRIGIMRTK